MKLESQVITLEQAIKLFDLGVDLASQFAWCWNGHKMTSTGERDFFINLDGFEKEWPEAYAAFTVAELGVMLHLYANGVSLHPNMGYSASCEHRNVKSHEKNLGTGTTWYLTYHKTEAEARGALLIYLLENNLLTPEQVNNSLNQ